MSKVPFEAFIRVAAKGAAANFAKYQNVAPIFITVSDGEEWCITALANWQNDYASKDVAFASMRAIAAEKQATRCAFVSEAWALDGSEVGNDAVMRAWQGGRGAGLEHVPGRREVVQIHAEDRVEGQRQAWMEIVRPEGREPYLLKLHIETFRASEGRAVGLLPAETAAGHA